MKRLFIVPLTILFAQLTSIQAQAEWSLVEQHSAQVPQGIKSGHANSSGESFAHGQDPIRKTVSFYGPDWHSRFMKPKAPLLIVNIDTSNRVFFLLHNPDSAKSGVQAHINNYYSSIGFEQRALPELLREVERRGRFFESVSIHESCTGLLTTVAMASVIHPDWATSVGLASMGGAVLSYGIYFARLRLSGYRTSMSPEGARMFKQVYEVLDALLNEASDAVKSNRFETSSGMVVESSLGGRNVSVQINRNSPPSVAWSNGLYSVLRGFQLAQ